MENLVPIGRFSQMTRLSIKALRHYDDIGLLAPAEVDESSGYRYYRPSQANQAEAIRILRSVDMPLEEIRALFVEADPATVRTKLSEHHERLARRLADQERMLAYLEQLIEREGGVMPYEVTVKNIPEQPVAAVRKHTNLRTIGSDIEQGFGELMRYLSMQGSVPAAAPLIVYHDVIDADNDGEIEICIPVAEPVPGDGSVYGRVLEGGSVAATVHHGPYGEIAPAYHTLAGWIQEHGHEFAGPPREIYLNDPREVGEAEQLTEVDWPIAAA